MWDNFDFSAPRLINLRNFATVTAWGEGRLRAKLLALQRVFLGRRAALSCFVTFQKVPLGGPLLNVRTSKELNFWQKNLRILKTFRKFKMDPPPPSFLKNQKVI